MSNILNLRNSHEEDLRRYCQLNGVSIDSMLKLLEAEKTKKLLKRNALMQQNIDKEIENTLEDENR